MPSPFRITKEDVLRSQVIKPGWYLMSIENVSQGPGKNDPNSITTTVNLKIEEGEFAGVPIQVWFSEKAAGRATQFIQAVFHQKVEDAVDLDLDNAIGRRVKGYVVNDKFNNQITNKVADFMAA